MGQVQTLTTARGSAHIPGITCRDLTTAGFCFLPATTLISPALARVGKLSQAYPLPKGCRSNTSQPRPSQHQCWVPEYWVRWRRGCCGATGPGWGWLLREADAGSLPQPLLQPYPGPLCRAGWQQWLGEVKRRRPDGVQGSRAWRSEQPRTHPWGLRHCTGPHAWNSSAC